MSVLSEKPSKLLLTGDASRDIGNYYFSLTLKENADRESRAGSSSLIVDSVAKEGGVEIPYALFDQFVPVSQSLRWSLFGHLAWAPSIFIAGKLKDENINMRINDAIITIQVVRKILFDFEKYREVSSAPQHLRMAWIDQKQNRIIAATYDLTNNNRLEELNVSLAPDEVFRSSPLINPQRILVELPSRDDRPYDTAGYVTEQMVKNVKELEKEKGNSKSMSPLMEGIIFSRTSEGFFLGNHLTHDDFRKQAKYASESGYYIKERIGELTVGLSPTVATIRKIKPWEISVPESLPKA